MFIEYATLQIGSIMLTVIAPVNYYLPFPLVVDPLSRKISCNIYRI
jgi:hypothetical protein